MSEGARSSSRIVIVTGALGNIGRAVVDRLAADSCTVVASDLATGQLGDDGVEHLDVTDPGSWERLVAAVLADRGRIDGLVNVAGVVSRDPLVATDDATWAHVIGVNQTGTFYGIRAVAPSMMEAGAGSIVNISSSAGMTGVPGSAPYVASKWAVRGLTKAAALELGPAGVRVNSVHPGAIESTMARRVGARQPIDRFGAREEVAAMVAFLVSDESSFSTGAEFLVDGGATAGSYRD